jgi:hypothetical protein
VFARINNRNYRIRGFKSRARNSKQFAGFVAQTLLRKYFFYEVSLLRLRESIIGIIGSAALGVVHKSTRSLPDSWLRQCKNHFFKEARLATFARINNGN